MAISTSILILFFFSYIQVFHLKRDRFVKEITKKGVFGEPVCHVGAVEFQKRGLAHIHLLTNFAEKHKLNTPEAVDRVIEAQIPDPEEDEEERACFDRVKEFMLHRKCGEHNPNAPCMKRSYKRTTPDSLLDRVVNQPDAQLETSSNESTEDQATFDSEATIIDEVDVAQYEDENEEFLRNEEDYETQALEAELNDPDPPIDNIRDSQWQSADENEGASDPQVEAGNNEGPQPTTNPPVNNSLFDGPNPFNPMVCKAGFPIPFCEQTNLAGKFPEYRRPDNGRVISKPNQQGVEETFTNQWVVAFNRYLLLRFNAHINVIKVADSRGGCLYVLNYIYKGQDEANVRLCRADNPNEILNFIQGKYISAHEADYRIKSYPMYFNSHTAFHLAVHLPGCQAVFFKQGDQIKVARRNVNSTLTAWFELNKRSEELFGLSTDPAERNTRAQESKLFRIDFYVLMISL